MKNLSSSEYTLWSISTKTLVPTLGNHKPRPMKQASLQVLDMSANVDIMRWDEVLGYFWKDFLTTLIIWVIISSLLSVR